jgi:hypothetical protein
MEKILLPSFIFNALAGKFGSFNREAFFTKKGG